MKISSKLLIFIVLISVMTNLLLPFPVAADELTRKERKFVDDTNETISYIWGILNQVSSSVYYVPSGNDGNDPCQKWVLEEIDTAYKKFSEAAQLLDDIQIPDTFVEFESNLQDMRSKAVQVKSRVYKFAGYMYDVVCPSRDTDNPIVGYHNERQAADTAIRDLFDSMRIAKNKLSSITAELTEDRGGVSADNVVEKFVSRIFEGIFPDECFIATAAYGTKSAEEINILREFRDIYLLKRPFGRLLVDLYYSVSPPFAYIIEKNEILRFIVREAFIDPLVNVIEVAEPVWD